jgi:hypothetical protein
MLAPPAQRLGRRGDNPWPSGLYPPVGVTGLGHQFGQMLQMLQTEQAHPGALPPKYRDCATAIPPSRSFALLLRTEAVCQDAAVSTRRSGTLVCGTFRIRRGRLVGPFFLVAVAVMAGSLLAVPHRAGADPSPNRHASGLVILGPVTRQQPPAEVLAVAYDDAVELARANPSDFGYPWIDKAGGRVVLTVSSLVGARLARGFLPRQAAALATVATRAGGRSWAHLEWIKDDATRLVEAGLPDADLIWVTESDTENNRILITVSEISDRLLEGLAKRYGTDSVAIRHDPSADDRKLRTTGRNDDWSPFYGGAHINLPTFCTSGFPWVSGSTQMMLTAAHCAPTGGLVNTPIQDMGSITSGSRENWSDSTGTTYYTGQSTYRGDVALIQMNSGRSAGTSIYVGPAGSGQSRTVREMWSRSPQHGDHYCTSGIASGELCGWVVDFVGVNVRVEFLGGWARHVTIGSKLGWCARPGDSGAPVYTIRSDGGVAAKGILSGGSGGGSDYYGGAADFCLTSFTDIWDPYHALPGVLKTG